MANVDSSFPLVDTTEAIDTSVSNENANTSNYEARRDGRRDGRRLQTVQTAAPTPTPPFPQLSAPLDPNDPCPTVTLIKFIDCRGGVEFGTGKTCAQACDDATDGDCCVGTNSCFRTTACIAISSSEPPCSGNDACSEISYYGPTSTSPYKPVISAGSCVGNSACKQLGASNGGNVWSIENSCTADEACYFLAYGKTTQFSGNLKDRCCTVGSCKSECGTILNPTASCDLDRIGCKTNPNQPCPVGYLDCRVGMAFDTNGNPLNRGCADVCGPDCCIGTDACGGTTACIEMSSTDPPCSGSYSCNTLGTTTATKTFDYSVTDGFGGVLTATVTIVIDGTKPVISAKSCIGLSACTSLGNVFLVQESCVGDFSCKNVAANENGVVPRIINSCLCDRACEELANRGIVTGDIRDSCCTPVCWGYCRGETITGGSQPSGGPRVISPTCSGILNECAFPITTPITTPMGPCPNANFILCLKGMAYDYTGTGSSLGTCHDVCGRECCQSPDDCDQTSACIERSRFSPPCSGIESCKGAGNANAMPVISAGSCQGNKACFNLGKGQGNSVQSVELSCNGNQACSGAAYSSLPGASTGTVKNIRRSCIGLGACKDLATEGTAKDVELSCTGEYACYRLAYGSTIAGNVFKSCCGLKSCANYCANLNGGTLFSCAGLIDECGAIIFPIKSPLGVTDSCPTANFIDCRDGIAYPSGSTCTEACLIQGVYQCCTEPNSCTETTACIERSQTNPPCSGPEACFELAYQGLNKPVVSAGSCQGNGACKFLAKQGRVWSVQDSCTADNSCSRFANGPGGSSSSFANIQDSCCTIGSCQDECSTVTSSCNTVQNGCTKFCQVLSQRSIVALNDFKNKQCATTQALKDSINDAIAKLSTIRRRNLKRSKLFSPPQSDESTKTTSKTRKSKKNKTRLDVVIYNLEKAINDIEDSNSLKAIDDLLKAYTGLKCDNDPDDTVLCNLIAGIVNQLLVV